MRLRAELAWCPTEGVTDHDGKPLPAGMTFPSPPPPGIGIITSARSAIGAGQRVRRTWWMIGIPAGLLVGGMIGTLPAAAGAGAAVAVASGVGAFVIILVLCYFMTDSVIACTYVGSEGAALYKIRIRGNLVSEPVCEMLRFAEARALRTEFVRISSSPVLLNEKYVFTWIDARGNTVFQLRGAHQSKARQPHASNLYHFASATETAWSEWLLRRLEADLTRQGYIRFDVNGSDWVGIRPGGFMFHFNGATSECSVEDIKSLSLWQGTFSIVHKDARWFSQQGKFKFQYGNIDNAKVFLLAIERILGLSAVESPSQGLIIPAGKAVFLPSANR